MNLSEFFHPTATLDLDGLVVEAVSALPDDELPGWEGNDALHGPAVGKHPAAHKLVGATTASKQVRAAGRVAPFVRILRRGMRGEDVIAVQRALRAAGVRKIPPTGAYGPVMVKNVKEFQSKNGIEPTGVYGKPTHSKLLRFFDGYGSWLMLGMARPEQERAQIVATALFGVRERTAIHYSQGSERLDAVARRLKPPHFPTHTDCSGFLTWCYQVAGAPDPSGSNYNVRALHYTGSMADHGRKVATPQLGDLILYGPAPTFEHVTVYIGGGRCVSNGSEIGPLILPVDYRPDRAEYRSYL